MSYPVIKLTKTGTGRSAVHVPDTFLNPFNIGLGCVVTLAQGESVTYSVEHTFENALAPDFNPATATWFKNSGLTDKNGNENGNYAYAVNAISLNITAATGNPTVTLYILQSGAR